MKKIIFSIAIISAVALGTVTLSSAFFSDTEISQNNILAAGSLDLIIGNESYYNGQLSENTTWQTSSIENQLFLNFLDIKPSDWGEDTISITVDDNEAWACVDVEITANDDNTCNEPELLDDPNCVEPNDNDFDGELGDIVEFIFWIDDGDNVLEDNEYINNVLAEGTANEVLNNSWVLADSSENRVGGQIGEGLSPLQSYYIGKAWCFGDLTPSPLTQDGVNNLVDPSNTNGGITCDGSSINNASQTDKLLADFEFRVEQHRNNPAFLCNPDEGPILWQIGDVEALDTDNPVDELNWTGVFGVFPPYSNPYVIGVNNYSDFPWNSNFNQNQATEIDIDFNYAGAAIDVKLRVGWSPGRSGVEQKEFLLDNVSIHTTPNVNGVSAAGWWENMPRREDSVVFNLTPDSHTITLKHLKGDGTLWDYVILEKN